MARLQTRATTLVLQIQQQIEESLASIIDGVAYVCVVLVYVRQASATVGRQLLLRNIQFKK